MSDGIPIVSDEGACRRGRYTGTVVRHCFSRVGGPRRATSFLRNDIVSSRDGTTLEDSARYNISA